MNANASAQANSGQAECQRLFEALCTQSLQADVRAQERACGEVTQAMLEGFVPDVEPLKGEDAQRAGHWLDVTLDLAQKRGVHNQALLRELLRHLERAARPMKRATFYRQPPGRVPRTREAHTHKWALRTGVHPVELEQRLEGLALKRRKLSQLRARS